MGLQLELDLFMNDLEGFREILPMKRGPQDRVAIDNVLPGPLEGPNIQAAPQRIAQAHAVYSRLGRLQAVKKYPLLQGRQFIDVFNGLRVHGTYRDDINPRSLTSQCWR